MVVNVIQRNLNGHDMVMKERARLHIVFAVLLSISMYSCSVENTLSFNGQQASFRTTDCGVVEFGLPDGYKQDEIRVYKGGDKTTLIIPFIDSSILYISTDIYNNPNRNNIESLQTVESFWRIHFELLYAIKETGMPDELKQQPIAECNCTYYELLDYEIPMVVDLKGEKDVCLWRDVLKYGVSVGYVVRDTTKVKSFDHCLETAIVKSPQRMKP